MKACFPFFGGKSRVADLVWDRFGDVPNYVEPFAGSLAVLLSRPQPFGGSETVNDLDCFIANFFRAVKAVPDDVALWTEWPVNEADLHARHKWLVNRVEFRERMKTDPDFYDAKIAGWWVWGLCMWIGSGWCAQRRNGSPSEQLPHLGDAGMGVHRKLPHLGDAGRGICDLFTDLSNRLRRVRVACGEWDRVLGESVTVKHGLTAVFLDPPYDEEEHAITYSAESSGVAARVREWAIANGDHPLLRIALCGYEGEHVMPASWDCVAWKAHGGYGSQAENGTGRDNSRRERVWFSPNCLAARMPEFQFA